MESPNLTSLQLGEPFNPYGLFRGVFIPEAICKYRGLSSGAKVIYGRLCRYAGKDGYVYPAVSTLADETGMGETQARKCLKELGNGRFISVDRENRHYRNDSSGGSNRYVFLWHAAFLGDAGASRKAPPPLRKTEGVPLRKTAPPTPAVNRTRRESSSREPRKESQPHNPPAVEKTSQNPAEAEARANGGARQPLSGSQKADDDEKPPQPRAPGETPRKEFLLRVAERHSEIDGPACLADVQGELRKGAIPFEAFLRRDLLTTTNAKTLTNPRGYYRDLAKRMVAEHQKQMAGISTAAVVETPRCAKCNGSGYVVERIEGQRPLQTGEFCVCKLGEDLAALERRAAKKAAASVERKQSGQASDLAARPAAGGLQ